MDTSLNKYISDTGFCSRREADRYIDELRVTINGKEAHKGNRVKEGDIVHVDGEPLKKKKSAVYIMLNKPKGITCTTDTKDKTNIIDFIKYKTRIFPIGRLDKLSEGLIFLTNDGDIVNKILRAGNGHEKEYIVTVDKNIDTSFVNNMRNGVRIMGTLTNKCFVKQEADKRFSLGYRVTSLKRIRIMNITVSGLAPGNWRYFNPSEIESINQMLKGSSKTADGEGMGE